MRIGSSSATRLTDDTMHVSALSMSVMGATLHSEMLVCLVVCETRGERGKGFFAVGVRPMAVGGSGGGSG